jgi:hypothetical protein
LHPVTDDGVIVRGRTYALGAGLAATALWLPIPPLPGSPPPDDPSPQPPAAQQPAQPPPAQGSGGVHCDRTLSPHGHVTIDQAVHARELIGTLCLHGGVYRTGDVWLRRRGMTITSAPGERATWRGRIVVRATGITIERMNLDGTGRGRSSLPNPTINGTNFTLRDSDVTNRTGICVHPLPYAGLTPTGFTIERNRIHDCGRRPRTNHDHGIYVAGGNGVIRGNAVFGNADRGIQLYPFARHVRVVRNTIDGNGEGVHFGLDAAHNTVSGNLITDSQARWNLEYFQLRGRGNRAVSNCVSADSRESYYRERGGIAPGIERYVKLKGNVDTKVRYVDEAHGDLRQASPDGFCAGTGAPDDVTAAP